MTTTKEKIKVLDENFNIKDEEEIIESLKQEKNKKENYKPTFIEKIAFLIEKKLKDKNFSDLDLEEWLEPNGICFKFAKRAEIKRTQLRKYFDEIKQIKILLKGFKEEEQIPSKVRVKLVGLIPKFAYAKGRKLMGDDVYEFFSNSLRKVKDGKVEDFKAFEQILEAILAYHTYHKPKE